MSAQHALRALGLAAIAVSTLGSSPSHAPRRYHFEGRLVAGERFERVFADSLHFLLRPADHEGWSIVVVGDDSSADFAGIVTPPFHGPNPTQIDSWHFDPRDSSGASPGDDRGFSFVTNRRDYASASAALDVMLWPNDRTDAAVDSAQAVFDGLRTGSGALKITRVKLEKLEAGSPARFDSLSFEVDLILPHP
ncbi:MAG: hypothetical protein E6K80_11420 [Candidatus Eisenbacteria bacterium]|uniref:Uncharacterized protein n=1 Tax=Eiseniibacteriota bacterium TaxID=2212470 RepID=A0A538U142_UNCEI|nr:MAG: hypothetical protein E6K80_11420 [Candidatus Eisenbacteria bacterium]